MKTTEIAKKPTKISTVKRSLDYTTYLQAERPQTQLSALADLAEGQRKLEKEVEDLKQSLKKKEAELAVISEERLPEMMEDLNLSTFKTRSGLKISLEEKLFATISKENAPAAFAWLDKHGYAKLIKRQFIVEFGKGEEAWAAKFARDLAKRKKQLEVEEKKGVHAQTLKAFCKEQLREGKELPLELFGVHRVNVSKVEIPT